MSLFHTPFYPHIIVPMKVETSSNLVGGLKALAHPTRMAMMELLIRNPMINVSEITKKLNLEQAIVSQHLRVLRYQGFVTTEKNAQKIKYYPELKRLEQVIEELNHILAK